MNQTNRILIVLGASVFFILIVLFLVSPSFTGDVVGGDGSSQVDKHTVTCNVIVDEDLFSGPDIKSASCSVTSNFCSWRTFFNVAPFSIGRQDRVLTLDFVDDRDSVTYTSGFVSTGSSEKTLRVCSQYFSGSILLKDDSGNIKDSYEVTV